MSGPPTWAKIPHRLMARTDLSATAKLVWAAIVDRIGENDSAWPGIRTIAADVGMVEPRNVLPHIRALSAAGEIIVEKGGPGGANRYRLPSAAASTALLNRQRAVDSPPSAVISPPGAVKATTEPDPVTKPSNQTHAVGADAADAASAPARRRSAGPTYPEGGIWGKGRIRLDTGNNSWVGITDDDRRLWAEAYPTVSIECTLARIVAWCLANGARGKKQNYERMIQNWLAKDQDRGTGSAQSYKLSPAAKRRSDREFPQPEVDAERYA